MPHKVLGNPLSGCKQDFGKIETKDSKYQRIRLTNVLNFVVE